MVLKCKRAQAKGVPATPQFCLVQWIVDDQVSVMPVSSVSKDSKPVVGAVVGIRWKGKAVYKADILKISRE